jgi:hypothetical protein
MARSKKTTKEPSKAQLEELIEEATVDAYDESEQSTGFFTMFEEHLEIPFTCQVLGVEVTVVKIDINDRDDIVTVCKRGNTRQALSILDLPLPNPRPKGWEWIEAYRQWARGWR